MRVCGVPGCPSVYPRSEGSRCAAHRKAARQARYETNNVYSSKAHRAFRNAVLTRDVYCQALGPDGCVQFATVADHYPLTRRELVELGLDPNSPTAGRGLCATHHNQHTAATTPSGWADR